MAWYRTSEYLVQGLKIRRRQLVPTSATIRLYICSSSATITVTSTMIKKNHHSGIFRMIALIYEDNRRMLRALDNNSDHVLWSKSMKYGTFPPDSYETCILHVPEFWFTNSHTSSSFSIIPSAKRIYTSPYCSRGSRLRALRLV